jgi:hypothetical protein
VIEQNAHKTSELEDFRVQMNKMEDSIVALKRKGQGASLKAKLDSMVKEEAKKVELQTTTVVAQDDGALE